MTYLFYGALALTTLWCGALVLAAGRANARYDRDTEACFNQKETER